MSQSGKIGVRWDGVGWGWDTSFSVCTWYSKTKTGNRHEGLVDEWGGRFLSTEEAASREELL